MFNISAQEPETSPISATPFPEGEFCSQFEGKLHGLCNAFCEAANCDSVDAKASATACRKLQEKITPLMVDFPELEIRMAEGTTPGNCGFKVQN